MLSPETISFVIQHISDDVLTLSFKKDIPRNVDFLQALAQIKARQTIKKKLPEWYENEQLEMPVQLSIEQSSSQQTAEFKASLFEANDGILVDLTGGMGIDCFYVSQKFSQTFYVEQNADLCQIAEHNFKVFHRDDILVKNASAEDFLNEISHVHCIFIDPARRGKDGQKVFFLSDCQPDVTRMIDVMLEKADSVLIKLSPMLDMKNAVESLKCVSDVYVVSVENECKELLVMAKKNAKQCQIHTVNFIKNDKQQFSFSFDGESQSVCEYTSNIEKHLYEPNASLMKVGAFKLLAEHFALKKLHPNTHLYTSEKLIADFPGRTFTVKAISSFAKKDLHSHFANIDKANISVRNFPESVEKVRAQLKLKEGGDVYLFATTLNDEKKVLVICEKA